VRRNLGLPDARLEIRDDYKIALAEVIRELQPHTVILPYWEGRHPDHYNAAKLGYEACFVAGLKNYPLGGEAFRPFKILYAAAYEFMRPTFCIDITKQFERRKQAILAYASQFAPRKKDRGSKVTLPLDELEGRMNAIAQYYGRLIGVQYAEGFMVKEVMQVDDVMKLQVRSI
jgi:LmbE family N-acetylglucosaminyl deacetylase